MAKKKKPQTKPKTYQELKTYWYKKLAKSGFEDIENDKQQLKQSSSKFSEAVVVRTWSAKSEYYSMAGQFLHSYKFKTPLERIVWEYHANGISIRDIADTLNKVKRQKLKKDKIFAILKRLIKEMKSIYLVSTKN
jgi:hypothetical protein